MAVGELSLNKIPISFYWVNGCVGIWGSLYGLWSTVFYLIHGRYIYPFLNAHKPYAWAAYAGLNVVFWAAMGLFYGLGKGKESVAGMMLEWKENAGKGEKVTGSVAKEATASLQGKGAIEAATGAAESTGRRRGRAATRSAVGGEGDRAARGLAVVAATSRSPRGSRKKGSSSVRSTSRSRSRGGSEKKKVDESLISGTRRSMRTRSKMV